MGKYDAYRQQLSGGGVPGNPSPSPSPSGSKYGAYRDRIKNPDYVPERGKTTLEMASENKQYADAMKPSRLKEVADKKISDQITMAPLNVIRDIQQKANSPEQRAKDSAFRRLSSKGAEDYTADIASDKAADYKSKYDALPWYRKKIVDFQQNPVGRTLMKSHEVSSDVLRQGLDTASLGVTDAADRSLMKSPLMDAKSKEVIKSNRERSQNSLAGTVGAYGGYLAPGAAADRIVTTVGKAALKKLPKVAQLLTRGTAAGTLDTAAQEGGDVAFRGGKFDPLNVAVGGVSGGLFAGSGLLVGKAFRSFMNRGKSVTPQVEQRVGEMLALPEPKARGNMNTAQTPDVVYGPGRVHVPEPLALPQGNIVRPTRLKPAGNNAVLDNVMQRIKPIVTERMTPPLENPNELAKWVQSHLGADISLNEVRKLPYEDLRQMAEMMRSRLNVADEAHRAASEMGHNLSDLLDGNLPSLGQRVARNAQERTYGVYPDSLPNVKTPQFNREVMSGAAAPVERVGRAPVITEAPVTVGARREAEQVQQGPVTVRARREAMEPNAPLTRPQVEDAPTGLQQISRPLSTGPQVRPPSDELKFAQSVKNADTTDPELLRIMNENPMTGARTTNTLNQQAAQALIKRHGAEKLTNMLTSKSGTLSSTESTAAQMMAKYYSGLGGDDNLAKSIDLVSKTARSGRELGQAVQALSQWNKLTGEGVMLLGEKQLNRRVANVEDRVKLSVAQAKPLQEVGQKLESVQAVRSQADEVVQMLANRSPNTPFTDAEKSLIQQFNAQVNKVSAEVAPILRKQRVERQNTIREVGAIKPKDRTRDQVVNYLDAQAAKAREKLKRQRNVGIIADTENPVILHSIIGASHLARGVVKFADWSEQMVKEGISGKLSQVYTKSVQRFRKENGLPTTEELNHVVNAAIKKNQIDEQQANSLRAMASEIGFYTDDVKRELTRDLQMQLKDLGKATLGEKIAAVHSSGMLLNGPTFERNAIGNIVQLGTEKFNKLAAVPIDWTLSKLTGERTIQFFPHNQEKFWRNFAIHTKAGWDGVSVNGTLSSYDIHPAVFGKRNPLRYLTKATGASLQGFDGAAYNAAYGDLIATFGEQLGKSQRLTKQQIKQQMPELIKQLDDRIYQMADEAGLYATYQDTTLLSKAAQAVKRGLNKPTDMMFKSMREKGIIKEGASLEGFGLGDIVLKFTRTPANLVMRGIDYSPLGFAKGLYELIPLVIGKTDRFNQVAATRALSRAITGTIGFTGLGFVLAKNGILSGSSSQDKDKRSIQEQSGMGAYKVNWSALRRWAESGFDSDAAKYQKGDRLMDYAWIQPVAISLGMGVNAAEAAYRPLKPGEERTGYDIAWKALAGGFSTILENPVVTGLSNVVDATTSLLKNQDASRFGDLVKGVPASFIPSALNQARNSTDNYQRETFDENILKTMLNMVKNKVPGLSKKLPISYDSLGKPRERIQDGQANTLGQYLNAFLNPAKVTKFEVTPEAKLVLDVLNDTGDQAVLPRVGDRSIEVDKKSEGIKRKNIPLNAKQYSDLQRRMGEMVSQEIAKSSVYLSNPRIDSDKKAKRLKGILDKVGKKARNEFRKQEGYDRKK